MSLCVTMLIGSRSVRAYKGSHVRKSHLIVLGINLVVYFAPSVMKTSVFC